MFQFMPPSIMNRFLNNINSGILYCKNDIHSTILYANKYFYDMLGYTPQEVETKFQNHFADMVVDHVPDILKKIETVINEGICLDYEYRMRRKDGSIIWIHDTAAYDKENNAFFVVIMDITDIKDTKSKAERFGSFLDYLPNKIIIADANGNIEYKNKFAANCEYYDSNITDIRSLTRDNIIGKSFNSVWKKALQGQQVQFETRYRKNSSTIGHDTNYFVPVFGQHKNLINIIQVGVDLSKQNDALTSLPTRSMLEHYYNELRSSAENFHIFLFVIDTDNFKAINDIYGHTTGDEVIKAIGKRLEYLISDKDYICRFGGDEFILLLDSNNYEEAQELAKKILLLAKQPIEYGNYIFNITHSIGIAFTDEKSTEYSALFEKADFALYSVKNKGKNNFEFFQENLSKDLKVSSD